MERSSSRLLVQIILASEIGCPQQKSGGFLRSRSRRQQCAIILAQNGEPGSDISRVIVEMGGWETHIGANQRCCQFGDQLLESVSVIAEALPKRSSETGWMPCPVAGLMRDGGCPGGARVELLDRRHGDDVRAQIVISTIAAAAQPRGQPIDEARRPRTEAVARRDEGEGLGIEIARQCIDLIGIEDRIGPHDPALLIDELTRTFV